MGRPEPCVLFAQTFVHPHLDEYVDEVLFAEPVVVTACEFLEQNALSTSQAVTLAGATLPPSFALEVFVQCEGETRFRRLCQPFLYSHSSSNVLEVEAVVTNHLVVRGSYRSLSLVIYGNTAEDLGQFNIGLDDSSITNLVSSDEGKLEDLPLPLLSSNMMIEKPICSLTTLSLPVVASDISIELKQFLQMMVKILEILNIRDRLHEVIRIVASVASSHVSNAWGMQKDAKDLCGVISVASKELLRQYEVFLNDSSNAFCHLSPERTSLELDIVVTTSKHLVDMLSKYFHFNMNLESDEHPLVPKTTSVILGLSLALLLCSGRESCFHFVNIGAMELVGHIFGSDMQNSSTISLLLLGVIEQATRHSVGCEGFLGWWPREDENVPSDISEGYSQLLNLLLQKPRHDIASLTTYVLHRLRFYEVASRYESAVLSILGGLATSGKFTSGTWDTLISTRSQLKKLLKLINSYGPIDDPSPAEVAARSLVLCQSDGPFSFKATNFLISLSKCCFSNWDIDSRLLVLLKEIGRTALGAQGRAQNLLKWKNCVNLQERGFLPLSAALLSSTILQSEVGHAMDIFVDIASSIEAIILSLLFTRSGLIFLLEHPELADTIIYALRGVEDVNRERCIPLRYASILIANGFFCGPSEVATIVWMHLRVVNAIDCLLTSTPHSEEFLWVLWELCGLSRSDCGRQALLVLGYFPEAISILIETLHSIKEPEPVSKTSGASPPNLAIFHSVAEIFEVIVTDLAASSLGSWIGHAVELQKALHSSSLGSNKKDAPTRMLEWIDAGVFYHKNGAIGVLKYAAVVVSGGDAHLTTSNMVVSDLTDVENIVGDSTVSDVNVIENLGKLIAEKTFDGVALRDSSIVQLTTAFRILAYISENLTVATALYDEGAISVIYTVLVNCAFMLERSSNSYDYLVDEGTECNSTQDLLLERNREQNIIDLLIPSLLLLVNLLRALQEAKEQHRNTKLMNSLLRLHREVSPKLAAHASDLSSPYPLTALGFGAICHLIASALACWPIYGWIPGLFSSLLVNVQATSLLTLGPKETCSLLCLLNDLFPDEGVWLWKNGMPLLSALKKLSIGTLLGPQKERQINWYLEPGHHEKLTNQLTPQVHKISHVIQQYAISTLVVIQDMLRVFVICMSCEKFEIASALVRPILSWTGDYVSECSSFTETDAYKVFRYLDFLTSLLEHPRGKGLLLKEGVVQLLVKVLDRSFDDIDTDEKQFPDIRSSKCGFSLLNWCLPVFKSISLLSNSRTSLQPSGIHDLHYLGCLNTEDCTLIWPYILEFGQVLPVGKELLACLTAFRDLVSFDGGQCSLESILSDVTNHDKSESQKGNEKDGDFNFFNRSRWMVQPPLLSCLKKLLRSVESKGGITSYVIEAIDALSCGCSLFCMDGTKLILDRILKVKFLFGLSDDGGGENGLSEESTSHMSEIVHLLDSFITACENLDMLTSLYPAIESAKSLSTLLQNLSRVEDDKIFGMDVPSVPNDVVDSSKIHHMVDASAAKVDDFLCAGGLGDKFLWECPEILPDRLTTLPTKRKMPLEGGPIRRARGDNSPAETTSQNTFSRGSGSSAIPTGPTRRDTFRQRKPNTSRPPSMHVDDYVARERSVDNVIAVQRVGSSSGRPPSIHVDEFMARQRERQNPIAAVASEATLQGKPGAQANDTDQEKFKSKQMKTDMDDDLHGIDIIFDGEESEPDDKLPFPQLDDSLQQHAPAMVEQGSPHSIVEETESDANENSQFSHLGTPLASNVNENAQSELSSRMSVSRPEMPLAREPSVTSEKKYLDQSDDPKNVTPFRSSNGSDSPLTVHSKFPTSVYNTVTASPKLGGDARATPPKFFPKNNLQRLGSGPGPGFQGHYDQRALPNQPPLPPMPPPPSIVPVISQAPDLIPSQSIPFVNAMNEGQQQFPTSFQAQSDYASAYNNSTSFPPLPVSDSKYSKTPISSSGGPVRLPPPLPPTPPPFLSPQYNLAAVKPAHTQSSVYHQGGVGTADFSQTSIVPSADGHLGGGSTSGAGARQMPYPLPPIVPQLIISRPSSMPANLYGSISSQSNESPPNILQNLSIPQSSLQSIHSYAQLQPLQPPQLPRPPQPPQHLRPPIQASQQLEQGVSLQSPAQIQIPQIQMIQQPHVSPIHYYQSQPLELSNAKQPQSDHVLPQVLQQPGNGTSQQQQDLGMSLHEYFKSPEAIQSLLSDREKLCQLLEQHPKLMQMLQERLGQL